MYFIELDPTRGSEINKTRPCVIISPDDMNRVLNTVIVAPLTSTIKNYPMRVNCIVAKRKGQVALDQIRTIDKNRLKTKIALLRHSTQNEIVEILLEMFKQ
ncbi:type II toxin-antitoxin system PemK/MazF family toxin [Niabella ginsengisoli]|uniref:Type II toxin-antitoxin system PemK/MazF family toxin n=1 Tax=Niabella ginsengisoli TaxID=522298 RepID=A0ABS9SEX1_9BACT|nr:type II toxin-antitoxin system PemK/MazF family toxin [Niabella ginsengisoli]MCH5596910.1 type II toxin-antitoxin system PemK/MazF family toxin [Niabella ginsengisoli]